LLKRTRVRHHADIARAIETRLPELAEQHPELLAHHHARGGEPFAAVALFLRAGRAAAARSAVAEARAHLQEARQLLNAQPDSAQRSDANRALSEAEQALTRARTDV
jgi:predicted ATPase